MKVMKEEIWKKNYFIFKRLKMVKDFFRQDYSDHSDLKKDTRWLKA